jgi:hypothetical protein
VRACGKHFPRGTGGHPAARQPPRLAALSTTTLERAARGGAGASVPRPGCRCRWSMTGARDLRAAPSTNTRPVGRSAPAVYGGLLRGELGRQAASFVSDDLGRGRRIAVSLLVSARTVRASALVRPAATTLLICSAAGGSVSRRCTSTWCRVRRATCEALTPGRIDEAAARVAGDDRRGTAPRRACRPDARGWRWRS